MSARSLMVMCALAALAHCAKSEIVSVQEQRENGRIVVNDPTAKIGSAEKHIKTPWMIVSPDGKKGFANEFTTNAISVVTGDSVNYYAHQQDENGDRTKVIHFTVDENGIPSRTGEVIDTTSSGETNNAEKMKNRKLIGVSGGTLYFYPCEEYGTSLAYNPERGKAYYETKIPQQKCLVASNLGTDLYMLTSELNKYNQTNVYWTARRDDGVVYSAVSFPDFLGEPQKMIYEGWELYTGNSAGDVYSNFIFAAKLPGVISGLSKNDDDEIFATTKATNAFYNVTLGRYNVVKDENGNPKPMVPQTQDGLIKVIDNRKKGGKFLYVTSKSIHSIDD